MWGIRGAIMAFAVLPASLVGIHFCVTGRDATRGSTVLPALHIRDEVRLCEGRGRGAVRPTRLHSSVHHIRHARTMVWAHYATLVSAQPVAAAVEAAAAAVEAVATAVEASAPPRAGRTCEW